MKIRRDGWLRSRREETSGVASSAVAAAVVFVSSHVLSLKNHSMRTTKIDTNATLVAIEIYLQNEAVFS